MPKLRKILLLFLFAIALTILLIISGVAGEWLAGAVSQEKLIEFFGEDYPQKLLWILFATIIGGLFLNFYFEKWLSKTEENTSSATKKFEPEIRDWLKKRYQNRLDQKLAGRLPINLRRIDFSESAAKISPKKFKAIEQEDMQGELLKFYHEAEERLLIVGAPGAGKTTLLLQLAVGLLENEENALPAVVNLATWSKDFKTLDEWLRKILPVELGVSTALAERLLAESRVVLLFDGLDEIGDAEQRTACLAAIDLFVSPARPRREFVISSRTQEFREAGRVPLVSFPVEVGALTMPQIERELTRRQPAEPEDRDLLAALRADPLLRAAAETPFYFNCLQLLFGENRRPVFSAADLAGREREILDFFVFNELGKCSSESSEWVSFLAERMSARELVRFELLDLNFQWLKNRQIAGVIADLVWMCFISIFFISLLSLALNGVKIVWWVVYLMAFKFSFIVSTLGTIRGSRTIETITFDYKKLLNSLNYILYGAAGCGIAVCVGVLLLFVFDSVMLYFTADVPIDLEFFLKYSHFYYEKFLLGFSTGLVFLIVFFSFSIKKHIHFDTPYKRFISSLTNLNPVIAHHFTLRSFAWGEGNLPFCLVDFLNELTNQKTKKRRFTKSPVHLMESDGASWRFRHRLIQEWFAARWVEQS